MKKLPTRIIAPPEKKPVVREGRRLSFANWYRCDDGNEYTAETLADHLAKHMTHAPTRQAIISRLVKYGWNSPLIIRPTCRRGYTFDGKVTFPGQENFILDRRSEGNPAPEWKALGCKPRTGNLARMRPLGTFERMML